MTWKAGVSRRRAEGLVRIARRVEELPACWALFEAGRLTEDAMVRIARRVPACRDEEVAGWAPGMLISQLDRSLRSCPELLDPDPNPKPEPFARERFLRMRERPDGSGHGEFSLPPDEMAQLKAGLQAVRDAELRHGLEPDAEVPGGAPGTGLTWADALVSAWPRRASTRSTRAWPAPVAAVSAPRWSCTTTSTPTAPSGPVSPARAAPTSAVACRIPSAERVTT